jgi:hypothetical protein
MFARKRVCRYWNKLAALRNEHLARLVFEESNQLHTMASPTWAGSVLQLGSELRVPPHYSPRSNSRSGRQCGTNPGPVGHCGEQSVLHEEGGSGMQSVLGRLVVPVAYRSG